MFKIKTTRLTFFVLGSLACGLSDCLLHSLRAQPVNVCQPGFGQPTFLSDGNVDDGTGGTKTYRSPQTNAQVGFDEASSGEISAFKVEGSGLAKSRPGSRNPAETRASTKATTGLTVGAASKCKVGLDVSSSIVQLIDRSQGEIQAGVTIRNAGGNAVFSQSHYYMLTPVQANPNLIDVLRDGRPLRVIRNAGGNLIPPDSSVGNVELRPGNYSLVVEITVMTSVKGQADLTAATEVSVTP